MSPLSMGSAAFLCGPVAHTNLYWVAWISWSTVVLGMVHQTLEA